MRYARTYATVLLTGALGCDHNAAAPVPDPPRSLPVGWMTAIAEGESWNPLSVSVSRQGDFVVFAGDAWPGDESTLTIRLSVRLDLGTGPQVIGPSSDAAADVMYRPWYAEAQAWTASGAIGSGTVTLTTVTSERAAGTFSFTANAVTPSTNPLTYRVTNGSFNVRW